MIAPIRRLAATGASTPHQRTIVAPWFAHTANATVSVRMAGALVTGHAAQIQQYAEQVRAFVKESRDEASV